MFHRPDRTTTQHLLHLAAAFPIAGLLLCMTSCGDPTEPQDKADPLFAKVYPSGCADAGLSTRKSLGLEFPKGFLWGTATAGFQVEMGCPTLPPEQCEDRNSDWYQWVTDPELVKKKALYLSGQPVAAGPGMWETYDSDFRCANEGLHNNAVRISIEWSRLFPDASASKAKTVAELEEHVDKQAVKGYRAMLQSAIKRGLQPMVTLHHYTLPLWIHDGKDCHLNGTDSCKLRGWLDRERTVAAMALYAGYCGKNFGDLVDLWATLNEPYAVVLSGYILPSADRTNPPGKFFQVKDAIDAAFAMMEAHARMYDAVAANDKIDADKDGKPARIGLVNNLTAIDPSDPDNPAHVTAAKHLDHVYNHLFLEATINGRIDRDLDGTFEKTRQDMAGRMDWIGINYYTRMYAHDVQIPGGDSFPYLDSSPDLSKGLWVNYPQGLARVVEFAATTYKLPVIITENGTANDKSKALEEFLVPHLEALHGAIEKPGVEVEGYFYWSLLDNYEWNHGMAMRFGMYAVETGAQEKPRRATPLAHGYGAIARDNAL